MSTPELEAGIVSADAQALVDFYVAAFGFSVLKVLDLAPGMVHRLGRGTAGLKVFQPKEPPATPDESVAWNRQTGFAYAAIHVDDAAAALAAALDAGATVVLDLSNHRPGACMAMIADPEGNVLEILQED